MASRFFSTSTVRQVGVAVAAATLAIFGGSLSAREAIAQVGLNPMVIQSEVSRGQAQSVIAVTNPTGEPMRVRMYAEPFTYDQVNGFVLLDEDSQDLTPYLQFSPREFVIPPNEVQRVRVVGLLPPSLEESEYRAVIFTESLPESAPAGSSVAGIQTRIGSTVYFRQPSSEPMFSVVQAQWNTEDAQAQLLLSNVGEATARPNAQWEIRRGGEVIASGQSGATTVIEGRDRLVPLPYLNKEEASLSPGNYEVVGELVWRFGEQQSSQSFSVPLIVR